MKIIKRLILGLAILTILLVGGVFLALNLIDPNDYKDKIQSLALEKTGRSLSIDGDIGLSYFPWAGFNLGSIAMANPDGFGDSAFVQIDSAQIKVKLLPLLKKTVTVNTVELKGLNLDLQRAADGTTNWDDLAQNSADSQSDTSSNNAGNTDTDSANGLQDLTIGSIVISDAQVNWRDAQNNTDALLTNFSLSSDTIELAKPFAVTTDFKVQSSSMGFDAQVNGTGVITADPDSQQYQIENLKLATTAAGEAIPVQDFTLDLEGDVVADLLAQTATVKSLTLNTIGVELSGDMQITDLDTNPTINAALSSNTFNPATVAEKLNVELPVTQDPQVLKTASVTMNLSGSAKAATLDNLTIKLDDTTFGGSATLPDLTRAVPPVTFDLALDAIDLDRYLPPVSDTTSSEGTASGTVASSTTGDEPIVLPVEMLRQLVVDGKFKVGSFKASNLTTQNIEIPITANSGVINLENIKASLYEGEMATNVAIDVTNADPQYQFSTSLSKIQAEPLLQDMLQKASPLSGESIISANISTTGGTVNQLTRNLNGEFVSDFTDGAINGINIGYQLRRAKSFFSNATETSEEPVSKTDFSALHISAVINNGILQSDDLDIRAPALRITGAGSVNLPEEYVDYTARPGVVGSVEGQGGKDLDDLKGVIADIPIRGTFDELSSDFGGTVFAAIKDDFSNRAEDAAKALAKQEADKIKAEAQAKADAVKREAEEKLQAEQARLEQKAQEQIEAQKAKADEAVDEIKDKAKDKLKDLLKF